MNFRRQIQTSKVDTRALYSLHVFKDVSKQMKWHWKKLLCQMPSKWKNQFQMGLFSEIDIFCHLNLEIASAMPALNEWQIVIHKLAGWGLKNHSASKRHAWDGQV